MEFRFVFLTLLIPFVIIAQHASDLLCFTIHLNDNQESIFLCPQGGVQGTRVCLSGPVVMDEGNLLFYSTNGYVLYNQNGELIDSHSVIKQNKNLELNDPRRIKLAFPLDLTTLVYFKGIPCGPDFKVFTRKLFGKDFKKLNWQKKGFEFVKTIHEEQIFNLNSNSITDLIQRKSYLLPNLVGFTSIDNGRRWWALEKFYSMASPLIIEEDMKFLTVFPGPRDDVQLDNIPLRSIEPLGTYRIDGRWYFYGIYMPMGGVNQEKYLQKLFVFDQAGNLMYKHTILKQELFDVVIGRNDKDNTVYVVQAASKNVFTPAVDITGDIYYGIIDYNNKRIDVMLKMFYRYFAQKCDPNEVDMPKETKIFEAQKTIIKPGEPSLLLPQFTILEPRFGQRIATEEDLIKNTYLVKIGRKVNERLRGKLRMKRPSLPDKIERMALALSEMPECWDNFYIALLKYSNVLSTLHYASNDEVYSARVLAISNKEVFVRVDLSTWAEIVVFSRTGDFINRFVFNRQSFEKRKDVIGISHKYQIIEHDYECGQDNGCFYKWSLSTFPRGKR